MATSYFILEKGIIERQDLSIYEKMCCVVLAKWATEEIDTFNMETLSEEMSCSLNKAKETISQLKAKGFIQSIGKEENEKVSRIIKARDVEGLEPINFGLTKPELTKADLLMQVRTIIEEPINDSEAKIILNFAADDIEKIKLCYKKAKNMQVGDKIEALMMELQRKEKTPATLPPITEKLDNSNSPTEKKERPWYLDEGDEGADPVAPMKQTPETQINTTMIHKMKAYKKYGK